MSTSAIILLNAMTSRSGLPVVRVLLCLLFKRTYSNIFVDEPGIIVIQYLGGDDNNSKFINTYSNIRLFIF